ncbi:MAG: LptF/LptG family permease, partial [Ginsengibacter sp.]
IKVGKKEKDKSTLHNVLIYEQSNGIQDNTIISENGKMTVSADKKFLEFRLQNGHRYSEKGDFNNPKNEFVQMGFKEYNKLFDLTQLNIQKTSDSLFMNNMRMKTLRLLDKDIDSLKKIPDSIIKRNRSDLKSYIYYAKYKDTARTKKQLEIADKKITDKNAKSFDELIPDSLNKFVRDQAAATVASIRSLVETNATVYDNQIDDIIQHKIEWHKKLSLSVACMVLFFIGAPLGSIIRKGGLGLPLVVALLFFMVFYLLNIFGEKFTKDHLLDPIIGMWLPVIVLTPIGFFLTYKATHDSQLFNKEFYYRLIKNVKNSSKKMFAFGKQ